MSSGRVFQTRGPATGKARLPTVESLTGGTSRRLVPAERNVRRPGRSATGTRGPKHWGMEGGTHIETGTITTVDGLVDEGWL